MKAGPIRTCLGCRQAKAKRLLVRLVRDQAGAVKIDRTGRSRGRGAYVCRNAPCLARALKGGRLAHAFRAQATPSGELTELAAGSWGDRVSP